MAQTKIEVMFDDATGKIMVAAAMSTQQEKDFAIKMLLAAANVVVGWHEPVIKPASVMPVRNGNGTGPKILH